MEKADPNRRPLTSRNTQWAKIAARLALRLGLTPNRISLLSIVFAGLGAACFAFVPRANNNTARVLLFIGAAAGIQFRLLCNMLDGMVAIEGGLRTKTGELYNEFPDRFADALIIVGAGYASSWMRYSAELGWLAAILAVLTAYNRALGVVAGASQQFCGPMAKPHRMATLTAASLLSVIEVLAGWPLRLVPLALVLIAIGCVVTMIRRTQRIVRELNSK